MDALQLHVLKPVLFTLQANLGVTYSSVFTAGAKCGRQKFEADKRALLVAVRQIVPSGRSNRRKIQSSTISRHVLVANAVPLVLSKQVERGKQQVSSVGELEFALLDSPLLLTEFSVAIECFRANLIPVETDIGGRRIVDRSNQSAVSRGQTHQPSQAGFRF